jgi:hypothetical protein
VHLAARGVEVDTVVRDDAGEQLRDPAHRDRRRRRARLCGPSDHRRLGHVQRRLTCRWRCPRCP